MAIFLIQAAFSNMVELLFIYQWFNQYIAMVVYKRCNTATTKTWFYRTFFFSWNSEAFALEFNSLRCTNAREICILTLSKRETDDCVIKYFNFLRVITMHVVQRTYSDKGLYPCILLLLLINIYIALFFEIAQSVVLHIVSLVVHLSPVSPTLYIICKQTMIYVWWYKTVVCIYLLL